MMRNGNRSSWCIIIVLAASLSYQGTMVTRSNHQQQQQQHASLLATTNAKPTPVEEDGAARIVLPSGPFHTTVVDGSPEADIQMDDENGWEMWQTNSTCRTAVVASLQRVWTTPRPGWCCPTTHDDKSNPTATTLVLIKVPKSASSTVAGVALRLEQQLANCRADWQHGTAAMKRGQQEREQQQALSAAATIASSNSSHNNSNNKDRSTFWIAPIRDPAARALSSVYFHQVSFHARAAKSSVSPSISFVTDHLMKVPNNYIFHYVRMDQQDEQEQDQWSSSTSSARDIAAMRRTVSSYDFFLVVDRLDESLVLLSILLNVPLTHILTVNSKQAGSWYSSNNRCIRLHSPSPAIRTELQQKLFATKAWTSKHALDQLLYDIAHASLTATIQHHQAAFDIRWQEYKTWQERIATTCATMDVFPCSFDGLQQLNVSQANCYLRDFGCGYPCIDALVKATSS
jgi:Sulfotransferase family